MGDLKTGVGIDDWEVVCDGGSGFRARLHPPIGGAICIRCRSRADDLSFLIEGPGGNEAGGLCDPCLVAGLRQCLADAA